MLITEKGTEEFSSLVTADLEVETGRLLEELENLPADVGTASFINGQDETSGLETGRESFGMMDDLKDELQFSNFLDDQVLIPGLEDDTDFSSFSYLSTNNEVSTLDFDSFIKSEPHSPAATLRMSPSLSDSSSGSGWMPLDSSKSAPETPPVTPPELDLNISPPTSPAPPSASNPVPQSVSVDLGLKREVIPTNSCSVTKRLKTSCNGPVTILPAPPSSAPPVKLLGSNGVKLSRMPSVQGKASTPESGISLKGPRDQPLVLTAAEFAKLTQQGLFHIGPPQTPCAPAVPGVVGKSSTTSCTPVTSSGLIPPVPLVAPTVSCITTLPSVAPVTIKQETDMKLFKRQQRMIKNRESACLSRKKKREYMQNLEQELGSLREENVKLREEKLSLQKRISDMEEENQRLRGANGFSTRHLFSPATRKATAVFSVFLLLSLNLSSLSGIFLSRQQQQQPSRFLTSSHFGSPSQGLNPRESGENPPHLGRALLWANTLDFSSSEENNDTVSLPNSSGSATGNLRHPICPLSVNKSESLRLNSELRDWFRDQGDNERQKPPLPGADAGNLGSGGSWSPSLLSPKFHGYLLSTGRRHDVSGGGSPATPKEVQEDSSRELQLYGSKLPPVGSYAAFLEAIERRQDTFYVVSFSGDHLLLPALEVNHTSRPKMALVLPVPSVPLNTTMRPPPAHVAMMQIECEVTNTRLLHVHEESVPTGGRTRGGKRDGGVVRNGSAGTRKMGPTKMQVGRRRGTG